MIKVYKRTTETFFLLWSLVCYSSLLNFAYFQAFPEEKEVLPVFHYKHQDKVQTLTGFQYWPTLGDKENFHVVYQELDLPPKIGKHCGGRSDLRSWKRIIVDPEFQWKKSNIIFLNETNLPDSDFLSGTIISAKNNSKYFPTFSLRVSSFQMTASFTYYVNNIEHPNTSHTLTKEVSLAESWSNPGIFRVNDRLYDLKVEDKGVNFENNLTKYEYRYYIEENTAEEEAIEITKPTHERTFAKYVYSNRLFSIRAQFIHWIQPYCIDKAQCVVFAQLNKYQDGPKKPIQEAGIFYSVMKFIPYIKGSTETSFEFQQPKIIKDNQEDTYWQKLDYGHSLKRILVTEHGDDFLGIGFGDDTANAQSTDFSFCRRYLTSIRKIQIFPTYIIQLPWLKLHQIVDAQNENFAKTLVVNSQSKDHYPFTRLLSWEKHQAGIIKLFFSSDSKLFANSGFEIILRDKLNPKKNVVLTFNKNLTDFDEFEWSVDRTNAVPSGINYVVDVAKVSPYNKSIIGNVHILLDNANLIEIFFEDGRYVFSIPVDLTLTEINEIAVRGLGLNSVYLMSFEVSKYVTKHIANFKKKIKKEFTKSIPEKKENFIRLVQQNIEKNFYKKCLRICLVILTLLLLI